MYLNIILSKYWPTLTTYDTVVCKCRQHVARECWALWNPPPIKAYNVKSIISKLVGLPSPSPEYRIPPVTLEL